MGVAGCSGSSDRPGKIVDNEQALLTGRVFEADNGKPLAGAQVSVGAALGTTSDKGAFAVSHDVAGASSDLLSVSDPGHAPVSKAAPNGDGYVELFSKALDVQKTIDTARGGEVKGKSGAGVKIAAGSLKDDAGDTPKQAQLGVATPDVSKRQDLGSLPGDFRAQQDGKDGKLAAESPIFVSASADGKLLKLAAGQKATLTLPSSPAKAAAHRLFRFDEGRGLWLDVGELGPSKDGASFVAEIDGFGWYTTGTFIDALSCVRACVVDGDGKPAPFAHALATGVQLFTQSAVFADADGCFAMDLPAAARVALSVQSKARYAPDVLVETGDRGSAADPKSCTTLATIVLDTEAQTDAPCAQGFRECSASCVDLRSDEAHCGSCDQSCGAGELCLAGACMDPGGPAPTMDAGTGKPPFDAGAPKPDAGSTHDAGVDAGSDVDVDAGLDAGAAPTCTSDPGCESLQGGCYALVPGSAALGTSDFCVSRFEVKNLAGVAYAGPAGTPWLVNSETEAEQHCEALGAGYALMTNAQWQTLARNLELVPANWTGGAVGQGDMVRGHVDALPLGPLSVLDPSDPCDQSQAPGCTSLGATYTQRRTHILSTSSQIWDVGGNVAEWVQPSQIGEPDAGFFHDAYNNATITLATGPADLNPLMTPTQYYAAGPSDLVSSSYPSNALVSAGALAVVDGQNFGPGSIWVRAGGTVFIRGSNFQGSVFLEPGAMYINNGSNINVSVQNAGTITYSATSAITGSIGNTTAVAEANYTECGGTCPANVQRFTTDPTRGLGWVLFFGVTYPLSVRGGQAGIGPLGGVFSAFPNNALGSSGFRCARVVGP